MARGRELGCIAGTRPMGLGRFFARFDEDCDGTSVSARPNYPATRAHLTLPVSHMGMLASSAVAEEVGEPWRTAAFAPARADLMSSVLPRVPRRVGSGARYTGVMHRPAAADTLG